MAAVPRLGHTGLLTFFGSSMRRSLSCSICFEFRPTPFSCSWRLGVINARVGALVAAVQHADRRAAWQFAPSWGWCGSTAAVLLRYTVVTALLDVTVVGGARVVFTHYLPVHYSKDQVLAGMQLLHNPMPAVVMLTPPGPERFDQAPVLQRTLRAAPCASVTSPTHFRLPSSMRPGDFVGFDVELAHRLAAELHVGLEFRPVDRATLDETLSNGYCDLVMAGIAVTTLRAGTTLFSAWYLDETLAFAVPDHALEHVCIVGRHPARSRRLWSQSRTWQTTRK